MSLKLKTYFGLFNTFKSDFSINLRCGKDNKTID